MERAPYYKKDPYHAWTFTVNKHARKAYDILCNDHSLRNKVVCLYFQLEKAKSGQLHVQGYVVFTKVVDFLFMLRWTRKFEPTTWFANRNENHEAAKYYHSKRATRVAGTSVSYECPNIGAFTL